MISFPQTDSAELEVCGKVRGVTGQIDADGFVVLIARAVYCQGAQHAEWRMQQEPSLFYPGCSHLKVWFIAVLPCIRCMPDNKMLRTAVFDTASKVNDLDLDLSAILAHYDPQVLPLDIAVSPSSCVQPVYCLPQKLS